MRDLMRLSWCRRFIFTLVSLCALAGTVGVSAQVAQSSEQTSGVRDRSLVLHDGKAYEKWLAEDVRWIITDQERADFANLSIDKDRDEFVAAFWERRNPTPGVPENRFKEEHYRRLAYANAHFGSSVPGWKTDRGRVYVVYGRPDKVQSYPAKGNVTEISTTPRELWYYKRAGDGKRAVWEFADTCRCGEYRLTGDQF